MTAGSRSPFEQRAGSKPFPSWVRIDAVYDFPVIRPTAFLYSPFVHLIFHLNFNPLFLTKL